MPGLGELLPLIFGESDDGPASNTTKLLRTWLSGVQGLEYALQQLYSERSIDTAIGAQLDGLGRLTGEKRNGLDDDTYRRHVRARISANRSAGTVADAIKVADLVVYDAAAVFRVHHAMRGCFALLVDNVATPNEVADVLISFLRAAASAGIRPIAESGIEAPTAWLILDDATRTTDTHHMIDARS